MLTDKKLITQLLKRCGAITVEFTDTKVSVETTPGKSLLLVKSPELIVNGKLQIQFADAIPTGINCKNTELSSFEGFPKSIAGSLNVVACPINSFEFMPNTILGDVNLNFTQFTSLAGISDALEEVNGGIYFSEKKIKHGGLGLLLIRNAKDISDYTAQFSIIGKYLGKPDQIFDCQIELIEAGFEEFAIL